MGSHNALHPPRRPLLRPHPARLPQQPLQQLASKESTEGVLDGCGSVEEPEICGAVAGECYGECVVLFADWEGWYVRLVSFGWVEEGSEVGGGNWRGEEKGREDGEESVQRFKERADTLIQN